MQRTGFKRPQFQRPPRPPVRPLTECRAVYRPAANEPVSVPKSEIVRSEPYRRWVATHACFGCAIQGWSQCAHDNFEKGMGLKVSDTRTFPLCAPRFGLIGCHQQFDLCIDMRRDERRELGAQYVERMQLLAMSAGWMNERRELIR